MPTCVQNARTDLQLPEGGLPVALCHPVLVQRVTVASTKDVQIAVCMHRAQRAQDVVEFRHNFDRALTPRGFRCRFPPQDARPANVTPGCTHQVLAFPGALDVDIRHRDTGAVVGEP
ncbi:MAG: hypothetical protein ABSA52_00980 [Candidatus Binatia bacterium]